MHMHATQHNVIPTACTYTHAHNIFKINAKLEKNLKNQVDFVKISCKFSQIRSNFERIFKISANIPAPKCPLTNPDPDRDLASGSGLRDRDCRFSGSGSRSGYHDPVPDQP